MAKVYLIIIVLLLLLMIIPLDAGCLNSDVNHSKVIFIAFPSIFGVCLDHPWNDNKHVDSTISPPYPPWLVDFVAYDVAPKLLNPDECKPVYPEKALKDSLEGVVLIQVLVDKEGNVRDAQVVKESGVNAGFEEAALQAAKKRIYRPAMQNNQPVAVWVAFKVRFQLRGQ